MLGVHTQTMKKRGPSRFQRNLRTVRVLLLFGAFVGAFLLHSWSLEGDPKFYAFLKTDIGKSMGTWFGWWGSPLEVPVADKPLHKLSADERVVLDELRQTYASRDSTVQPSYRDIRFRSEFADMTVQIQPPFMVISDMHCGSVPRLFEELHALHRDFLYTFSPLVHKSPKEQLIHVLLFDTPDKYHAYERICRGESGHTAGFYSPMADRLVLYDPRPCTIAGPLAESPLSDPLRITLRHEGGHQLCFAYGIHSEHRVENDWLMEGLASYCEERVIGGLSSENVEILRRAMSTDELTTMPLADLINLRSPRGLLAHRTSAVAYAKAWSLVHMLLQPDYRPAFESYIRFVRDPANFRELRSRERNLVLCQFLDMTQEQLDDVWMRHAQALTQLSL